MNIQKKVCKSDECKRHLCLHISVPHANLFRKHSCVPFASQPAQALLAEEALKDISHQLPSFQTSPDNPLIAALAGPSSDDDSSDDEEGEEQGNEDGNAHSSKTPVSE